MTTAFIVLTDLDYPDDESSLHIRIDAITSFRTVKAKRDDFFTTHYGVINLVGQVDHCVTETAEEIREKLFEAYSYLEGEAAEQEELEAAEEAVYSAAISKALGLDDVMGPISIDLVQEG